ETRDADALVGTFERRECPVQAPGRVRDRGAERRMQIARDRLDPQFYVADPLQSERDDRCTVDILAAALPDVAISLDEIGMLVGEALESRAADLLLALDQELHAQ